MMARPFSSYARALDVYWANTHVGRLMQNAAGVLSFAYKPDFLHEATRGISLSLPLREVVFEGDGVRAFFSGLLPEESVRVRLAQFLGVSSKNSFALLHAIGGECAGALLLCPEGTDPYAAASDEKEVLDEARLADLFELLKRRPFLAGDGVRLSLAGAQDKIAVGIEQGRILLLKGGQPTTHILKPIIDRVTDSAHNEFFCMRLAAMSGIDVPQADIHFVKGVPYYSVERYDRVRGADGTVMRIHQEDFCQALGVLPELKYEREGGPTMAHCQHLIVDHVARPAVDQTKLLERVIFNYLIGNADAHAKNFSLLYRTEKPELAPAYDVLCTAIYPDISTKMAMKIGGQYQPEEVFWRHWQQLVPPTKAAQTALRKRMNKRALHTLENAFVLKEKIESQGLRSSVFADICAVIERRASHILTFVIG